MNDWYSELEREEQEQWDQFVDHFRRDTLEKMESSAFVASLLPREGFDVKFAVETGAAIMLGKPIVLIVQPGAEIPGKLRLVADEVVEADLDTEEGRREIAVALKRLNERLG